MEEKEEEQPTRVLTPKEMKAELKNEKKTNQQIEKMLKKEKKRLEKEIKLLLLGAGESGKSTIAKQMKIIHLEGFTEEERTGYVRIIHENIYTAIRILIQATKTLKIPIGDDQKENAANLENIKLGEEGGIPEDVAKQIAALWKDAGIQEAYRRQAEFQLFDSAAYFLDRVLDFSPTFTPSDADILHSRVRTTGVQEIFFSIDGSDFRLVDVGGQRNERRKWLHHFDHVTAILFCVALSEYDLKLAEDASVNRMEESLNLFGEIINNEWFSNTSIILFLNKVDLFQEKIKKVNLNTCFPDYKDGDSLDAAVSFVTRKFVLRNETKTRHIYPHATCATDTSNILKVWNAVKDIFLRSALSDMGVTGM